MDITPDEGKLAELIVLVCDLTKEDPTAGATKLNKVLFFIDWSHMRASGQPVSGVEYQKLEWGPAPRRLLPICRELIGAGRLTRRKSHYFGYPQDRLDPAPDAAQPGSFSKEELDTINLVVRALWNKTAKEVSDMSHEEFGWRWVEEGEAIPYVAAFIDPAPKVTARMRERAAALAATGKFI